MHQARSTRYDARVDQRLKALYLLSVARNFTPAQHDLLVTQLGSLEALLTAEPRELDLLELPAGPKQRLREALAGADPAVELQRMQAQGIKLIGWGDDGYPALLAQLPDAPLLLYCLGDPELMRHEGLAIVGSRKCSERGLEHARRIARDLAELMVPVVSGLALGIDGAAHEGALSVPGPTVAVLGCGVDVIYPPAHHELYARICAGGLVVSEHPPGTEPRRENFPQRNRIIAGLTRGTLVVEAPIGSGALITARWTVDLGRELFAMPGPVGSPYVAGTHHLIKTGQAKLTESVDDILAEFGTNRAALRSRMHGAQADMFSSEQVEGTAAKPAQRSSSAAGDPAEQRVLEELSYEGTHVNDLVRKLGITTAECVAHLTMLEIKGLITSAGGGYYVRL